MKKFLVLFFLIIFSSTIFCQNRIIDKAISQFMPTDIYIYIKDTLNSDTVYQVEFVNNQLTEICNKHAKVKRNKYISQKDSCNYEIGRFKKGTNKKSLKLPENFIIVEKKGRWIYSYNCEKIVNYHTIW